MLFVVEALLRLSFLLSISLLYPLFSSSVTSCSFTVILPCVVVQLNSAAHCDRTEQPAVANLIVVVVRNVQLEEARVCNRAASFTQVIHESHFMPVSQVRQVNWQASATPYELEVECLLLLCKAFKHTPEAVDDTVVLVAMWV